MTESHRPSLVPSDLAKSRQRSTPGVRLVRGGSRWDRPFPVPALKEHVGLAAGIRAFNDRCPRIVHSGGVRARWTKALLYAAAVGAALSGCAMSVDAAHQVALVVVPAICTSANSSMNIVAHEDDDILFMNPPTYTDVAAGRCLTTVYLTDGDDAPNRIRPGSRHPHAGRDERPAGLPASADRKSGRARHRPLRVPQQA